ncbi:hypothetical protein GCK72_004600 [Caenorhabditis remanei]|uniref:Uncharacterized protein n=1 Tax=Caenorhabditis remanei TaxID=31234 RepID=A0A6A5HCK9_CAERE|nr:hypothetical protein GCK72_004600 [Caenorhabditis remanei]KAF1764651.1 hypothetical protein GCK72_004600 [Caenorhabditis remanei]
MTKSNTLQWTPSYSITSTSALHWIRATITPTTAQMHQVETIRDDLLEIVEDMDWLRDIFNNMEDIRKSWNR